MNDKDCSRHHHLSSSERCSTCKQDKLQSEVKLEANAELVTLTGNQAVLMSHVFTYSLSLTSGVCLGKSYLTPYKALHVQR